jgi:hypothetical protein
MHRLPGRSDPAGFFFSFWFLILGRAGLALQATRFRRPRVEGIVNDIVNDRSMIRINDPAENDGKRSIGRSAEKENDRSMIRINDPAERKSSRASDREPWRGRRCDR